MVVVVGCRRRGEGDEKVWVRAGWRWDGMRDVMREDWREEGGPAFGQPNGATRPRKSQKPEPEAKQGGRVEGRRG
jgi:hypothetical protein